MGHGMIQLLGQTAFIVIVVLLMITVWRSHH
jgi:hypothetical protein